MHNTYEKYLEMPKCLTVEEMETLHREMLAEIDVDEDALELYEDFLKTAIRYAGIRAEWNVMSREEKMERDSSRTSCHNSVIIHLNMLARYLKMQGKDASWRDRLGYEEDDRYYRKTMGDFACYVVFINSISAR